MMILNMVRQSVMILLGHVIPQHVRPQLEMLSLGHLTPSIVTPGQLKELLLKIQTKLSQHLTADPTKELWKCYKALHYAILIEDNKMLVLMVIPLLDTENDFEIYQIIKLSIPCPSAEQGPREFGKD